MENGTERVCHPQYYNSHPSGVECIEIIRHYICDIANAMKYMWRAGLKGEEGLTKAEKEVEDCKKALWYLDDYLASRDAFSFIIAPDDFRHPSRADCDSVASCYSHDIASAFRCLWCVGVVSGGHLYRSVGDDLLVITAKAHIQNHINMLLMHA